MLPESEFVLNVLANQMEPARRHQAAGHERSEPNLVFLLGAGCSRQYGLPSFVELLSYLSEDWCDESITAESTAPSLETLRDKIDKYWQVQGPQKQKSTLEFYLAGV